MKTVALSDVATFVRGVTFKPTDVCDDGIGVMRTKNVQEYLNIDDILRIPRRFVRRAEQYLRHGDILVSSANSWAAVGKACWVPELPEPLAIGGFVTALRATSPQIDSRFLYRWFTTPRTQATLRSFSNQTTNISNLNLSLAGQMPIPLPPLDQQRRATAILDQADALRAKRRQSIALLGDLRRSTFLEMFGDPAPNPRGWDVRRLGDLAAVFRDGPFGSNLKSAHYVPSGIQVIRLQNIGVGEFVNDDRAYVTPDHFASLGRHRCLPGDVVIATLGDPNLRACVLPPELDVALNKADCVQFRVNPGRADTLWACWLLNMPGTLSLATSALHGQTRTRIAMGQVRELRVPVPPLDLQREFATRVEAINAQRTAAQRSLTALDELFASLQARAFSGQL